MCALLLSEPVCRAGKRGRYEAAVWCRAEARGRTEARAVIIGNKTKTFGPVLAHALRSTGSVTALLASGLFVGRQIFSYKSAVLRNRDIKMT